ncbi:unnamed protein product [Sphagnum jensenii]
MALPVNDSALIRSQRKRVLRAVLSCFTSSFNSLQPETRRSVMFRQMHIGMLLSEWKATFHAEWCETFGNLSKALEQYEIALAIRAQIDPLPNHSESCLLLGIGRVQRAMGLNDQAVVSCSRACEVAYIASPEASLQQALCLLELSLAQVDTGSKLGAKRNLLRAERTIDASLASHSWHHVVILYALIRLFQDESDSMALQLEQWLAKARAITDAAYASRQLRLGSPWEYC